MRFFIEAFDPDGRRMLQDTFSAGNITEATDRLIANEEIQRGWTVEVSRITDTEEYVVQEGRYLSTPTSDFIPKSRVIF